MDLLQVKPPFCIFHWTMARRKL